MSNLDGTIRIPPAGPPMACSRCGGLYEMSVKLDDGTVLRGHVPGGPGCTPKGNPIIDKRARRAQLAR